MSFLKLKLCHACTTGQNFGPTFWNWTHKNIPDRKWQKVLNHSTLFYSTSSHAEIGEQVKTKNLLYCYDNKHCIKETLGWLWEL